MNKKKVNIIILNYNGKNLLAKYIPSVIEASQKSKHDCKVSVIDNKSSDESVKFIKDNFKNVQLYEAKLNKVLCSFNEYLKIIEDEIVIFLNNDIKVDPYFVDPLIKYFDDKDVLFVSPKELSMEDGRYLGNLNMAFFRFGLLTARVKYKNHNHRQYNLAAHGGAYDRKKFLYLDGYDTIYLPGIIEDLDLCYRGWKHGWKGIYEPESFFYHEGSTSFNEVYGIKKKSLFAHRNSFIFFWKNITSPKLIFFHLVFLPVFLLEALIRRRYTAIKGFFQALKMLPFVLERRVNVIPQFQINDETVINKIKGDLSE